MSRQPTVFLPHGGGPWPFVELGLPKSEVTGLMDYLRSVLVDDSLGICAELEAEMAAHVASYRCEWTETLGDPDKLRRFRPFVNSDAPDPSIVFVTERGQPRPARAEERSVDAAEAAEATP